jgi:hypothetical protein
MLGGRGSEGTGSSGWIRLVARPLRLSQCVVGHGGEADQVVVRQLEHASELLSDVGRTSARRLLRGVPARGLVALEGVQGHDEQEDPLAPLTPHAVVQGFTLGLEHIRRLERGFAWREGGSPVESAPHDDDPPRRRSGSRAGLMARSILQRRLVDVSDRLKRLRAERSVTEEQLLFLENEAEDARLRALVAETPLADAEARDARRHADAIARHRDALVLSIAELEREQDALLDRMSAELSAH